MIYVFEGFLAVVWQFRSLVFAFSIDVFELFLRDVSIVSEELHEEGSVIVLELAFEEVCAAVAHCESLDVYLYGVFIVGGVESV